jgi:hypothetical protein
MNQRIKILYLKENKKKQDFHLTKSQLNQIKYLLMDLFLVCLIRTIKLKEFFLIIFLKIKQTLKLIYFKIRPLTFFKIRLNLILFKIRPNLILFKIRLNLIQIFLQINQKH